MLGTILGFSRIRYSTLERKHHYLADNSDPTNVRSYDLIPQTNSRNASTHAHPWRQRHPIGSRTANLYL